MQIDIPQDLYNRLEQRAASVSNYTPIEIIRDSLDELDRYDAEVVALQHRMESIDDDDLAALSGLADE